MQSEEFYSLKESSISYYVLYYILFFFFIFTITSLHNIFKHVENLIRFNHFTKYIHEHIHVQKKNRKRIIIIKKRKERRLVRTRYLCERDHVLTLEIFRRLSKLWGIHTFLLAGNAVIHWLEGNDLFSFFFLLSLYPIDHVLHLVVITSIRDSFLREDFLFLF